MLKSLNGVALTSVEASSEAQKLIASARRLSLLVMRQGQPLTFEYRVTD